MLLAQKARKNNVQVSSYHSWAIFAWDITPFSEKHTMLYSVICTGTLCVLPTCTDTGSVRDYVYIVWNKQCG